MKSVLIVPSNTDLNRGDQALTWASIDIINSVFDGVTKEVWLCSSLRGQKVNFQTAKLGYPFIFRTLPHPNRGEVDYSI